MIELSFIETRFKVLENNLTNTYDRKSFEAVAITVNRPKLNAQVLQPKIPTTWQKYKKRFYTRL